MKLQHLSLFAVAFSLFAVSCNNEEKKTDPPTAKIKEEAVSYQGDSITMNGFVAYDESREGKRPAVLIIHEWWGLDDYIKSRARQLAELGYVAMAIDMYGNGKQAATPDSAEKLAYPFYLDPAMAKRRFDAAYAKLVSLPQTEPTKVAAMGYCFGGAQAINAAKLGADLKGVVSFHGNLTVVPTRKDLLKAEILVCHGAYDTAFVPDAEVAQFKREMDSIGGKYAVKVYPEATHAFTNPNATAKGEQFNLPIRYNGAADTASWKDMKEFFERIFK